MASVEPSPLNPELSDDDLLGRVIRAPRCKTPVAMLEDTTLRLHGGGCGASKEADESSSAVGVGVASVTVSLADKTASKKVAAKNAPSVRKQKLDACTRYPKPDRVDEGDVLMVLNGQGKLIDVKVISVADAQARVERMRDGDHAPSEISLHRTPHVSDDYLANASQFCSYRLEYCGRVLKARGEMQDAVTAVKMKTEEQLINLTVDMVGGVDEAIGLQYADYAKLTDVEQLAKLISSSGAPASVVFIAPPGSGKTWSAVQLLYMLAKGADASKLPLVPFLVTVQELAKMSKRRAEAQLDQQTTTSNAVLAFLNSLKDVISGKVTDLDLPSSAMLVMDDWALLKTAYELRLLVVIVDGIDEVGDEIDSHSPSFP